MNGIKTFEIPEAVLGSALDSLLSLCVYRHRFDPDRDRLFL